MFASLNIESTHAVYAYHWDTAYVNFKDGSLAVLWRINSVVPPVPRAWRFN